MQPVIDIEDVGLDAGAHLLVKHGLAKVAVGDEIAVRGTAPGWEAQLAAWCRIEGHALAWEEGGARIIRGAAQTGRWRGALKSGHADANQPGAVLDRAPLRLGLAARGAAVEAGAPEFSFRLSEKHEVWSGNAAELYAQAVDAQWNPDKAIDWAAPFELSDEVEDAIAQVMTYLIENENAALIVPARFLGQLHPHFREVQAVLAMQVADEARHIEVFTRRLRLRGREPALSTAGGQASLKTLIDESDFSVASLLLSVLGEGTFVSLLAFLHTYAPDPVTRQIASLAARDEGRHVAFGMSHLMQRLESEPHLRVQLANAIELRHETLTGTSGLNEEVFDALIILAAGEFAPAALARGFTRVQMLIKDMAEGRMMRLLRLGFPERDAERLAALHTRNFM